MTGIDNIIEMINAKTAEKEKEILSEAETHKTKKLNEAKKMAQEITDAITAKAEAESKAEVGRYEASAKLKSKYQLLEAKEALIEEILTSAKKHLEDLAGKKAYAKTLEHLTIDAAAALEETDLDIVLPKGHSSHITIKAVEDAVSKKTGKKAKISVSKETVRATGGAIVRNKDNTRWVNNTFEARFERLETAIRDKISEILFETENKEKE
ncbi:MAG: V-type ATP synthase subunit E [Candidatus Thorarchaeota archaeon]|jgi:V/A-type H+-transporting ATPase subunit E